MKSAIRSPGKARIAHQPGTHVRLKKGVVAFQALPVVTIRAERQVQTVRKVFRFTVDVSDVVPVTVGTVRSWFTR